MTSFDLESLWVPIESISMRPEELGSSFDDSGWAWQR